MDLKLHKKPLSLYLSWFSFFPCPFQNDVLECQSSRDLGFGDEIKDGATENNIFSFSPKSFYKSNSKPVAKNDLNSSSSKKKKKKKTKKNTSHFNNPMTSSTKERALSRTIIQDPKIMLQQVKVKIEKLPAKQITSNMIVSVSEDLSKRVMVSPKRKGEAASTDGWFASSKRSRTGSESPPTTPAKTTPPPSSLIRPAILNVQSPSSKGVQQKFSSNPKVNSKNNPFLPPIKSSSYLFAGLEDFEQAEEIIDEEEEVISEEEEDPQINLIEDNKDGYEDLAPSLSQVDESIVKEIEKEEEKEQKDVQKKEEEKKDDFKAPPQQRIRFPAQEPKNLIECKWKECQMVFTTFGSLSDHLKVSGAQKKSNLFFLPHNFNSFSSPCRLVLRVSFRRLAPRRSKKVFFPSYIGCNQTSQRE